MAFALMAIGCAFCVVIILAGIVGFKTGISPFGVMRAPEPLPPFPEINPEILARRHPTTGGEE